MPAPPPAMQVVELPKSDAGFGMIIAPDCTVSQFSGIDGAAQRAGVPLGSKITEVNGVDVVAREDILAELDKVRAGTTVAFTLTEASGGPRRGRVGSPRGVAVGSPSLRVARALEDAEQVVWDVESRRSPTLSLSPRGREERVVSTIRLSPSPGAAAPMAVYAGSPRDWYDRAHDPLVRSDLPIAPLDYTADLPEDRHPGGSTNSLGLRTAVHSAHGPSASSVTAGSVRHAPVTYLVATYTGELTALDKKQAWFQGLEPEQLEQLDRLGNELPHTQAEVCVELIGEDGRTSGKQRLLHAGRDDYHAFRQNTVDEFAVSCEYLGDIREVKLWLDRDGMPPSEDGVEDWVQALWKLNKVVVSCIVHKQQRVRYTGKCGAACCGKPSGDHATRTSRSKGAMWHFVPPRGSEWIGEKGIGDPEEVSERQPNATRPSPAQPTTYLVQHMMLLLRTDAVDASSSFYSCFCFCFCCAQVSRRLEMDKQELGSLEATLQDLKEQVSQHEKEVKSKKAAVKARQERLSALTNHHATASNGVVGSNTLQIKQHK